MADPLTVKDLIDKIEELAGVDIADVPIGTGVGWFPIPWEAPKIVERSDGQKVSVATSFWQKGQPCPLNVGMLILAMFDGDSEIRVYTIAIADSKTGKPPTRYTLSKSAFSWFAAEMTYDTFIQEVAEELCTLADVDPPDMPDEDEPPAVEANGTPPAAEAAP